MRSLRLAKVAAQAEGLRLKRMAQRQTMRAVYGVVAAVFALAVLVVLHVAGAMALSRVVDPIYATLIVGAVDLLILLIFGTMAASSSPGRIEREAYQVREDARRQLRDQMAVATLFRPAARIVGGKRFYGLTLAALTAQFLGRRG